MHFVNQVQFKKTRISQAVALSIGLSVSWGASALSVCESVGTTVTVSSAETNGRRLVCQSIDITATGSIVPAGMPTVSDGVRAEDRPNGGITITNAGTITTTLGSGISVGGSARVSSITNSGTVSSNGGKGTALNLTNTEFGFTVTNTGTLSGTINLGNNILNVEGSGSVINGTIGSGYVNVKGTWTKNSSNSISGTELNIVSGGTLAINGNPSIYMTNLNNNGVLSVAPANTVSIAGTYTQSSGGVLRTRVVDDGGFKHGKLIFSGGPETAVLLPAGFKIDVDVASGLSIPQNTILADVIKANNVDISSSTFTVTDNSSLFNFIAVKNGLRAIDLKVTTQGGTSAVDSVKTANDTASTAAAAVLDSLTATPGDMAPFINVLGALTNPADVAKLIKRTLPLMITSVKQSAFTQQRSGDRVIQAHQEQNHGLSGGDAANDDRRAWAKPFGSWADQGDIKGVTGYKAVSGGIVVGADDLISASTRLGAALSYSTSKIDNNTATNQADVTAFRFIGYGTYNLDPVTDLNFQADIGTSNTKGSRTVNSAGVTNVYSDYNSLTGGVSVGVGRNMPWSSQTTFTPSVRLSYATMEDAGYTETNKEAFKGLNLVVAKSTGEELVAMVEGKLTHTLSGNRKLVANFGAGYDFLAKKNSLAASYVGGGGQFVTNGMEVAPWSYRAGLSYVAESKKMEVTARYELEARESSTNQVASLKLRFPF